MKGVGLAAILGATAIVLGAALAPMALTSVVAAQCQASAQPSTYAGSYVNPFTVGQWLPARTDQGVDWLPVTVSPVLAIGNAVVTYSGTAGTGWPAGAFLAYQLTDGPAAGHYVYVAEHLTNLLPVGATVTAGQQLATALPGYPWTEWGWAAPSGPSPAVPYNGAADGTATAGGKAFARFLEALGVKPLDDPGPGSIFPEGGTAGLVGVMSTAGCVNGASGGSGASGATPAGFAQAVISGLGVAANTSNVAAVVAWEMAEGGWRHNNPLNTTLPEPGATDLAGNPAHVKAYPSLDVGLKATVSVLAESAYAAVVAALMGSDPHSVAKAVAMSPWGTPDFSAAIGLPYNP
jgi:hypothetical protein